MTWTNPFRKKKPLHVWEYEPYMFERGRPYVIQVDLTHINIEGMKSIDKFFHDQGIIVKLVPFKHGVPPLQPITVKRMTEEI